MEHRKEYLIFLKRFFGGKFQRGGRCLRGVWEDDWEADRWTNQDGKVASRGHLRDQVQMRGRGKQIGIHSGGPCAHIKSLDFAT